MPGRGRHLREHVCISSPPTGSLRGRPVPREDWQLSQPEPCYFLRHSFLTFNIKTLIKFKNNDNKSLTFGNSIKAAFAMARPKNIQPNHPCRAPLCQKAWPRLSRRATANSTGRMPGIRLGSTEHVQNGFLAQNRLALMICFTRKRGN